VNETSPNASPGSVRPSALGLIAPTVMALASTAGVLAMYRFFIETGVGQEMDSLGLRGATIGAWRVSATAFRVLDSVSLPMVTFVIVGVVILALLRRQPFVSLVAVVVLAGANVTTQVLKRLVFTRDNLTAGSPNWGNSLPSGHTAVIASAAIAVLLVVPPALRGPTAVLGTLAVWAIGYSTLVGQWHRPSDVVAGLLVSGAWGFAGIAWLRWHSLRQPPALLRLPGRAERSTLLLVVVGTIGLTIAAVAIGMVWRVTSATASREEMFIAYAGSTAGMFGSAAAIMAALLWQVSGTAVRGTTTG